MKYVNPVLYVLFVLIFLVSCSSPEEKAQKELEDKGVPAIAESLVDQARKGNVENVRLLLAAGMPVDYAGKDGATALAWAASSGHTEVLDVLLAAGADKNKTDNDGDTVLIHAVKSGKVEAAVRVAKSGANTEVINGKGETALSLAMSNNNWPMVSALGKTGVNLNGQDDDGRTLLLESIESGAGEKELAAALIAGGADIDLADNTGQTPFTAAVKQNQLEIVSLMAKEGADVNAVLFKQNTYPALMQAIEMKSVELVKVLIEAGADVSFASKETQDTCLAKAVVMQQKDIVQMLIKAGAKVDTHNIFYETPLFMATIDQRGKNLEIADILVASGADVNAVVTENGRTLVHAAVMISDAMPDSLQFLLGKGAVTNIYDNDGQTPLTLAVLNNKLAAVKILVKAEADVNFPAMNGKKPMFIADELDYYKISSQLRKAGAKKK